MIKLQGNPSPNPRFTATSLIRAIVLASVFTAPLLASVPAHAAGDVAFTATHAYPEGIAWSPPQNAFFVSSVHLGVIGQVTPEGRYTAFIRDAKLVSSVGLQLDGRRNLLWIAVGDLGNSVGSSAATQGKLAAVAAYDATTGERRAYHDLGGLVEGGHFANDLALDPQGNVYVTDSFSPVIYRVDTRGQASVFVRSQLFTGEGFNLNGIVHHAGGYLLVAKHNSGELFRVSTKGPREVRRVRLPEALKGADGLLLRAPNRLTVVQNAGADRVVQLVSNDGWQSAAIESTSKSAMSFPTTATLAGKHLYVLNSRLDTLLSKDAPKVSEYLLQRH